MEPYEFRDFPREEFELRCQKAKTLMSEKGFDWLFVSDNANFRYFTGCMSSTRNRPAFFFLPLKGVPFILAVNFAASSFRNLTWVPEVVEYRVPIKAEILRNALADAGAEKVRVGTELNDTLFGGFRMNMPFGEFMRLKQLVPDGQFVDASDLLWRLRLIKTDLELSYLRKACDITGKAYEYMFSSVHTGMTELDVSRLLLEGMMREGADFPTPYRGRIGPCGFIIADASRPLGQQHIPVKKVIREGDVLHLDTGAIYRGYHADFKRLGVVGKPNDRQMKYWEKSVSGIRRSLEKVKPGNSLGEIEVHWHGFGLEGVEYPFVDCDKEKPMEAGMTLAIETVNLCSDIGESFDVEENIIVTESGYELLSKTKMEFFEIR